MPGQKIDQEMAINIGAYTMLSGALHMITAGVKWQDIAMQMAQSADKISETLPESMVKTIDDMAVETVNKRKSGA